MISKRAALYKATMLVDSELRPRPRRRKLAVHMASETEVEGAYFTLFIAPGLTKWQDPRRTLSRGSFRTYEEALRWVRRHIPNEPYAIGIVSKETGELLEKVDTYYTVLIPPGLSKWQDPRQSLTRGAFKSKSEALSWARKNISEVPDYTVKMIRPT